MLGGLLFRRLRCEGWGDGGRDNGLEVGSRAGGGMGKGECWRRNGGGRLLPPPLGFL